MRLCLCFVVFVLSVSASLAAAAKPDVPASLAFSLHEIRDSQLNNELAMTLAVSDKWKVKTAEVQWNPNLYQNPAAVNFMLTGPADEVTALGYSQFAFKWDESLARMLGRQQVENKIDGGQVVLKPLNPDEFVLWMLQRTNEVSNIKVQKVEKPKVIVDAIKKAEPEANKQMQEFTRQIGNNSFKKVAFDTALVEFTCTKDGKRYEQQIALIIRYLHMKSPMAAINMAPANEECVYWTVAPVISAYALEGKLKKYERDTALIFGNSVLNPVWSNKIEYLVTQTNIAINQKQIQSQQEISRKINETSAYVNKTRQDTFAKRQDSMSKVSQGWTDVITDTDRWKDNSGKIHAVPSGYNYGYQNSSGGMIFNNSGTAPPGYTPINKTPWAW